MASFNIMWAFLYWHNYLKERDKDRDREILYSCFLLLYVEEDGFRP